MLTEILVMKLKDKKRYNKKWIVFLLELILTKKINIFKEINRIHRHIKKSNQKINEESTKISLIRDLSKILLELKFNSNHSIKPKCLKWIVQKVLMTL